MSDLDFTIACTVTFFNKKRGNPPNLNNGKYCTHLVIKGSDQRFGVNFIDGEQVLNSLSWKGAMLLVNGL